ncbi:MAG: hypothetical protein AAF996_15995 [Pseudomonadota bacterium]
MNLFRYSLKTDWAFYLIVIGYLYTLGRMTLALWFGDGVNIFATYSDAVAPPEILLDANKVYWSKSLYLFSTLFLMALNVDIRAAVGIAAILWSASLILIFGAFSSAMAVALGLGFIVVALQVKRGEFFSRRQAPQ